jgi:hypothetical protein
MSVPPDKLMEMMKQGQGSAGGSIPAPGEAGSMAMSESGTPPMSSPMSTPEPTMGSREGAMINLSMALDLIEQAMPALGPEADKLMPAIQGLNRMIGPRKGKTNELQQSEILQMMQSLPQAGGASPEMRAMSQAPIPGMPQQGGMPPPQ